MVEPNGGVPSSAQAHPTAGKIEREMNAAFERAFKALGRTDASVVLMRLRLELEELRPRISPLEDRILNKAELVELLAGKGQSISPVTVDGWIKRGCSPPYFRLGGPNGSPRFLLSRVLDWAREVSKTSRWQEIMGS